MQSSIRNTVLSCTPLIPHVALAQRCAVAFHTIRPSAYSPIVLSQIISKLNPAIHKCVHGKQSMLCFSTDALASHKSKNIGLQKPFTHIAMYRWPPHSEFSKDAQFSNMPHLYMLKLINKIGDDWSVKELLVPSTATLNEVIIQIRACYSHHDMEINLTRGLFGRRVSSRKMLKKSIVDKKRVNLHVTLCNNNSQNHLNEPYQPNFSFRIPINGGALISSNIPSLLMALRRVLIPLPLLLALYWYTMYDKKRHHDLGLGNVKAPNWEEQPRIQRLREIRHAREAREEKSRLESERQKKLAKERELWQEPTEQVEQTKQKQLAMALPVEND